MFLKVIVNVNEIINYYLFRLKLPRQHSLTSLAISLEEVEAEVCLHQLLLAPFQKPSWLTKLRSGSNFKLKGILFMFLLKVSDRSKPIVFYLSFKLKGSFPLLIASLPGCFSLLDLWGGFFFYGYWIQLGKKEKNILCKRKHLEKSNTWIIM